MKRRKKIERMGVPEGVSRLRALKRFEIHKLLYYEFRLGVLCSIKNLLPTPKTFVIVILRGLSPRANYTDRATAACQRR
jgi:hypothetical protein